jgi:hypothetical protein
MFNMVSASGGARWIAVCFAVLFAAACAQTKPDGLATNVKPGTGQDFVVNVGDRVFFEEDQSTLNSQGQATLANQAKWLNRYSSTRSPWKAMLMSAVPASTTSRLVQDVHRPLAITSYPRVFLPPGSKRFRTAKNGRWPFVTTTAAGLRTGGR